MNVRVLAETNKREVVLVNVAQNPDMGEVGDRERIRRSQALRPGGGRHLLVGDDSRGGSADFNNRRRVMEVCPQDLKMIQRGFNGDLGLGFGVLGDLKIVLRNRAMFIKVFRARELRVRQGFIRHRLPVIGKCLRNVLALHPHQELPFRHGVAKAGVNIHNASRGERNHRDASRNVGADGAGYIQFRGGFVLFRRGQGKLLGVINAECAAILFLLDLRGRRRSGFRISLAAAAT